MKRHVDFKNLGWLVSTMMHWCFAAPFLMWYMYKLIICHIVPDTTTLLVLSGIAVLWYNIRNRNCGYGLTYLKEWYWDRKDKEWQAEMRARRERSTIEHHRATDTDNDRIAK